MELRRRQGTPFRVKEFFGHKPRKNEVAKTFGNQKFATKKSEGTAILQKQQRLGTKNEWLLLLWPPGSATKLSGLWGPLLKKIRAPSSVIIGFWAPGKNIPGSRAPWTPL